MGILAEKTFFNKDQMNDIQFSKSVTEVAYNKKSFVYDFLSSLRQKVNDPLDKRKTGGNRRKKNN